METSCNKIHDFKECLAFSEQASHEDFWQSVYKKAFPDMIFATLCTENCSGQRAGIDRVIHLKNGKTLLVDEKKRRTEYDDILLEYESCSTTHAAGWMEKNLMIDYIAYAFITSKRCYVLPWLNLKRAWNHYKKEWLEKYKIPAAKNNGYYTSSVAVPTHELLCAIKNSIIIQL
jgi:hypothetical protein